MKKFLSKREFAILRIALALLLFVVLFNIFLKPVLTQNEILNKEIRLTEQKIKKYKALLENKERLEKKYQKYMLPENEFTQKADSLVAALSDLENLAKSSNIAIIDMRPQAARKNDLYHEMPVDLRLEGGIEGYLDFIYKLENSFNLLRIQKFQLTTAENPQFLEGNFTITQISEQ